MFYSLQGHILNLDSLVKMNHITMNLVIVKNLETK